MAKKKTQRSHSKSSRKHPLHTDVPHVVAYLVLAAVVLFAIYYAKKVAGLDAY